MTTSPAPRPIAALDVLVDVLTLQVAAMHTTSASARAAFALDEWLITHPKAPISTDADYAGWAEHIAAREADNRKVRQALLELP